MSRITYVSRNIFNVVKEKTALLCRVQNKTLFYLYKEQGFILSKIYNLILNVVNSIDK